MRAVLRCRHTKKILILTKATKTNLNFFLISAAILQLTAFYPKGLSRSRT